MAETAIQRAEREQQEIIKGKKTLQQVQKEHAKEKAPKKSPSPNTYIVGASEFGGPGDPTTRGDSGSCGHMAGKMAYAELNMSTALGNLPCGTKLKIQLASKNPSDSASGPTIVAEKMDIGLGGLPIEGHARRIDLWWQTAHAIGATGAGNWSGLVRISRVDGKPIIGPGDKEKASEAIPDTLGLPNPLEWGKELAKVLAFLLSGSGWLRILKIIGGLILILITINELIKIGPGNVNPAKTLKKAF